MLLTLSTTMPQASDLGFLLHKHPDRAQSFDVAVGTAHVLWPEVSDERSTVALLLEVDPVALVRGRGRHGDGVSLQQYVNDRPYVASSMLAVALGKVFRTAMAGRCDARPDLVGTEIPLEVSIPALPSRGGADLVRPLFEPLGWQVEVTPLPLDETVSAWGDSPYVALRLTGTMTLAAALTQLYVLVPVLDDGKHYWVTGDEVDKLLRAGGGWLEGHPERELVTRRYLKHQPALVVDAVTRLAELDDVRPVDDSASETATGGAGSEVRIAPLAVQRRAAVLQALREEGAKSVVDLGCGEGFLLRELVPDPTFTSVVGVDVSHRALQAAERRLNLDRMPDSQRARLRLLQSSVTYRDDRLVGHDAVVLMEVIEHVDPDRLPALERSVFGHARPTSVVVTTPNVEHNVRFETLAAGTLRHPDHRFEWTRAEFRGWADAVADRNGYTVDYRPVGDDDPEVGPPTQMAIFRRVTA
ncbi:3' terminal RNA ribose 2'-O-methyltransferase Hen1 [Aquipuribacter nitratireducens]|uniref:Small RNA 2'-O-methyltransferase n=1 Tax=Aquipuribacter nitratireducens TaxID=650104 RepID=A0ABW0GS76_9MICO